MRDGDIINNRAWFGFDVHDLYWLLDYLPRSDDFREDIKDAIKKLEPVTTKLTTAQVELLTESNRPLPKTEYFDHVNDCNPKTLNWIDGDAYCPECGEHGVVYSRSVWFNTRKPTTNPATNKV